MADSKKSLGPIKAWFDAEMENIKTEQVEIIRRYYKKKTQK
jgi:hypothetical protein